MQSASAALIPASSIARTRSARSLTTAARASKLGPSDGQWGLVILAVPIGTLLGLMLLTRLITRTGARLLAVPRAVVLLLITPLAALSTSRVGARDRITRSGRLRSRRRCLRRLPML